MPLPSLLREVSACEICAEHLPLSPRPIVSAAPDSRVVIIGQALGTRVHESGIPWDDDSGARLRQWLGVSAEEFYDPASFAIMPMGFCYPGRNGSGDASPRPGCAPSWHDRLVESLPQHRLLLLIGQYAQKKYLGRRRQKNLTETVKAWATGTVSPQKLCKRSAPRQAVSRSSTERSHVTPQNTG
ncbi:MAG: uracil-DNA glycosylase family protein [Deltaproteobacteria bacterium]|nr:uracil-DNA glycosylase family protein [Deltaproteobacteria bacterium]